MASRVGRVIACFVVLNGILLSAARVDGVGAILHKGGTVQITANGEFVWAVLPDHDAVARYSTVTGAVSYFALPTLGVRENPQGIAVRADGSEVWVAAHDSGRVFVLNGANGALIATLTLHPGSGPVSIAISPDGTRAYVVLKRSAEVAVFDAVTHNLITMITKLSRRPFGIAFNSAGTQAWLTHTITDGEDSYVTGIDTALLSAKALVVLKSVDPKEPSQISGEADPIPEGGYLMLRGQLAPLPGSTHLWLPVQYQNFHNSAFTPDSTVQAAIHKIDLNTGTHLNGNRVVLTAVYAHAGTTLLGPGWNAGVAGPVDLAFSSTGATAYLVNASSNDVLVFPSTLPLARPVGASPLTEIPVGDHPTGIVSSPVAERLYVLNALSRDLSVIDTALGEEIQRVALSSGVPEPLAPSVLVGARVFHSSDDPRMSANQKVACVSCHPNGETDGLSWTFEQFGAGQRKTLPLIGLSYSFGPPVGGLGQLHRGGDRDEVQDFEFTLRSAIMGGSGFIPVPNPPLGTSNAGLSAELDGLADYLLGLPAIETSPARAPTGALSEAAIRGALIFQRPGGTSSGAGCATCHPGPTFTDNGFHNIGGFAPAPEFQGPAFNTPSLIGAWDNAPYLQATGNFPTGSSLVGVVRDAESGGHGHTSGLNDSQRADLVEFLSSIDGGLAAVGLSGLADTAPPRILRVAPVSLDSVEVIFSESVDAASAGDPANYTFAAGAFQVAATAATFNASAGNRVRVTVPLRYEGCDVTYTLAPGPIEDIAATYGAASNNVLDPSDTTNELTFEITDSITVEFGNVTGVETFGNAAKDASFNPGLSNVSHDHWRLYPATNPETKGFLAFNFVSTLSTECGVASSSEILDARFSGLPEFGNTNTLQLRRCLMPWNEPPNDWCFGCSGALTRTHATYTTVPWHQNGAGALGGSGTSLSEYYPSGAFDVAAAVDASVVAGAVNERVEFASTAVTSAFRFWFDNPSKNFGYCVEVAGTTGPGIEFHAADRENGRNGFVLSMRFAVSPTGPGLDCNQNGTPDSCDISQGTSVDANLDGIPDECQSSAHDFVRGEANHDGSFNLADPIYVLGYLFGGDPLDCLDAADSNDDGSVDVADAIHLLAALFSSGPLPLPPFPVCGADPSVDGLGCISFSACP
ncbi:MAG: hypothetical protein ACKVX7_09465 [Planctomycetota bacterium]